MDIFQRTSNVTENQTQLFRPLVKYNNAEKEIHIGGATYDSTTKRIYVTQNLIEGNSPKPIIHVYELQGIAVNNILKSPANVQGTAVK